MPSGLSDAVVDRVLDKFAGASADTSLFGAATVYLHAYTTAPSDDNGTGRVDWGQGAVSVTVANGTNWPAAAARAKTSPSFTVGTNTSGATITVVAFGWESTSAAGGTYYGGGPVAGGSQDVAAGATLTTTATVASPSPS